MHSWGAPTPACFLSKSAEALDNMRVKLLLAAKKCKRVRKSLKREGIVSEQRAAKNEAGPYPRAFCMNVKRKDLQKLQFVSD